MPISNNPSPGGSSYTPYGNPNVPGYAPPGYTPYGGNFTPPGGQQGSGAPWWAQAGAVAAPAIGAGLGAAFGGPGQTTPQLPADLTQSRADSIGLMRYLVGLDPGNPTASANQRGAPPVIFNGPGQSPQGMPNGPQQQPFDRPPVDFGGPPGTTQTAGVFQPGQMPNIQGGPLIQSTGGGPPTTGGMISPQQQRVENVFGPIGIQATPLQRQATGGIQQFLNQPSPEARTMDALNPGLMSLFNQTGGAGNQAFGQAQQALQGQLGGQNPLAGNLQQMLGQQAMGANPLPQNAQNALGQGLNTDLMGGGVRDMLTALAQSGGAGGGLQALLNSGGGGADTSAIQRELAYSPNQQLLSALEPQFQRNLDMANQAGGRFGSANAIMRSRAVDDYNLMASQALQQDLARRAGLASSLASASGSSAANQNATRLGAGQTIQQGQLGGLNALLSGGQASGQLQQGAAGLLGQFGQAGIGNQQNAANMLGQFSQQGLQNQQGVAGLLGQLGLGLQGVQQQGTLGAGGLMGQLAGQAGQNDFNRLVQGYGVGQAEAQQNDVATQRNLAILLQQLGAMQQATMGVPIQTTPSGAVQGAQLGGQVGQLLLLSQLLGGGR